MGPNVQGCRGADSHRRSSATHPAPGTCLSSKFIGRFWARPAILVQVDQGNTVGRTQPRWAYSAQVKRRAISDYQVLYKASGASGRAPSAEVERWDLVRWPDAGLADLVFEPTVIRKVSESAGDTLWTAHPRPDVRIGLAFSWARVPPGVLVLDNPMAINSNVLLLDPVGSLVDPDVMQAHLTWLVYRTAWQAEIRRLLKLAPGAADDAPP
jgi:hypothetical protein